MAEGSLLAVDLPGPFGAFCIADRFGFVLCGSCGHISIGTAHHTCYLLQVKNTVITEPMIALSMAPMIVAGFSRVFSMRLNFFRGVKYTTLKGMMRISVSRKDVPVNEKQKVLMTYHSTVMLGCKW